MVSIVGRICGARLLKTNSSAICNKVNSFSSSTRDWARSNKILLASLGTLTGGVGALLYTLDQSVKASELIAHPSPLPWYHNEGLLNSLDHASVRRGFEVYKQVCAACHSIRFLTYRELVGVIFTQGEAEAEAAEVMITDGPNEIGEMFQRPGKLSDRIPSPYPNEEAARAANNGAFPHDLTYMVNARHGGEDYIFSILTGYCDPPAGVSVGEGQHYNPYFKGGSISMAPAIYNEVLEFSDGTPASASQVAKDICTFLKWVAEPEYEERKRMLIRLSVVSTALFFVLLYYKRHKWSVLKTRKIGFYPRAKN